MKSEYLVFSILLLILFSVVIVGYIDHTVQANKKEETRLLVSDAVNLILQKGENAFPDFREQDSKWFHGDTYVFVWRLDGIRVVYPPDLTGEGQNESSLLDVTGKAIGRLFIDLASSEGGKGWIDYMWPKPGESQPSVKRTYIEGVSSGGEKYLVGSGFYVDSAEDFVRPLQYVAIVLEGVVAATGLFLAIRKKRLFGYGIFLTFAIYVFYDLAKLIPLEVSDVALYLLFFVATLSILWAVILIYKEKQPG